MMPARSNPALFTVAAFGPYGSSGSATFLTVQALACREVTERGAPVLCIGKLDPYRRDAALLAPGTEV